MLFSIIIPIFNTEKYLKECLDSIYGQSFCDYEVVLVDDGSTDGSCNICDEYQSRYSSNTKVIHKKNEGALLARCDGFSIASGEYIVCCDSDDYLSPNALEILESVIGKFKPDIIQYDLYLQFESGKSWNINANKKLITPNILCDDIGILRNTILDSSYVIWSMCAKCIKSECIDKSSRYNGLEDIKHGEDTLVSLDIYDRAKNFVYIDDKIYNYRDYSGNTHRLPKKYIDDIYTLYGKMTEYAKRWNIPDYKDKIATYILDAVYWYLINISNCVLTTREYIERLKHIKSNEVFEQSYKKISSLSLYRTRMSRNGRVFLNLLYKRQFTLLAYLLKLRGMKRELKRS